MPPYKFDNSRAWGRHYGADFGGGSTMPMLLAMGSQVNTPANAAAYSFDGGVTFTQAVVPDPGAAGWFGAAYSPSLGYAVMVAAGGFVARSFDGITWAAMPGNNLINGNWQGGVVRNADDTLFVTSGLTGGGAGFRVSTSPDGATWTTRATPTTGLNEAFGARIRVAADGSIIALGTAAVPTPFIRSVDGGLTWAFLTGASGGNDDFQDFGLNDDSPGYIHAVGFTGVNVGDTFFNSAYGVGAWTRVLRDALNDPPNATCCAVNPDLGRLYVATSTLGIFSIGLGVTNNPPSGQWVSEYPAGTVGGASRGGYIPQLGKMLFCSATGGFTTHQRSDAGVWSSTVHPVLPGTARVKLDFLGFPPP